MARGGGVGGECVHPGVAQTQAGSPGPCFLFHMLISAQLWPSRQVCSDGFDYRGQQLCVVGSPIPQAQAAPSSPPWACGLSSVLTEPLVLACGFLFSI